MPPFADSVGYTLKDCYAWLHSISTLQEKQSLALLFCMIFILISQKRLPNESGYSGGSKFTCMPLKNILYSQLICECEKNTEK